MIAVTYTIELCEPALLTGLEGEPNSAISLEFIPGSALRGAVIAAYRQTNPTPDLSPFLDGRIRFLHAYPSEDYVRSLPLPLSLRRDKYGTDLQKAYDQAAESLPDDAVPPPQWQGVGGGFALWSDTPGVADQVEVHRMVNIHTTRERRAGRSTADEGAVFRYDALAEGQNFQAVVLCETEEQAAITEPLLSHISRIGKSIRGGYGAVTTKVFATEAEYKEHYWPRPTADERQIVILLSDAILRDANGQASVSPSVLAGALGLTPGAAATAAKDSDFAFLDAVSMGGFNRTWGLPLPQEQAYLRGSTLRLPPGTLADDDIVRLEAEGIGERREDGFGRIAIIAPNRSWELHPAGCSDRSSDRSTDDELLAGTSETSLEIKLTERIVGRILNQRFQSEVRTKVSETLGNTVGYRRGDLKSSQIRRIREELRRELMAASPTLDCIRRFIGDLRPTARRQFAAATIIGKPLIVWLEQQAAVPFTAPKSPTIGGVSTEQNVVDRMKVMAHLEYVDAVLARVAKQKDLL